VVRQGGVVAEVVGRPLQIGRAVGQDLALLAREFDGELTLAALDDVRCPAQYSGPFMNGNLAQAPQRGGGRVNRLGDARLDKVPSAGHHLVRSRRIDARELRAVAVDSLTGDLGAHYNALHVPSPLPMSSYRANIDSSTT
jgi:hypothetical protein